MFYSFTTPQQGSHLKQQFLGLTEAFNQTKWSFLWRELWKVALLERKNHLKTNVSLILREKVCTCLFYYMYNNVHKYKQGRTRDQ